MCDHTSVKTFTLHTTHAPSSILGNPGLEDLVKQCWRFWLNAFPALHRITVTSSNDPDWEDIISHANDSRAATALLTSLTHIHGKGGPKPLLTPQLTEVLFETQGVDILPLLTFAQARLQDDSGWFNQRLTDTSSESNLMPITLKLTNCKINQVPGTVADMRGVDGVDDEVNWTLTTFQDLENAITVTPNPVAGPDGWTFEGLLS